MLLSSIEFCSRYVEFVGIVEQVVLPSFFPAIRALYETAPEDGISPDDCFASENEAIGFVFKQVIRKQKELNDAAASR